MFRSLECAANLRPYKTMSRGFQVNTGTSRIFGGRILKSLFKSTLCISACCFLATDIVRAQQAGSEEGTRHHPAQDMALHEKFYSSWHMPDRPAVSCCNNADCYPTEIKFVGGSIYAKRREDGKFILVPPEKVEHNRDNPDGRNHL